MKKYFENKKRVKKFITKDFCTIKDKETTKNLILFLVMLTLITILTGCNHESIDNNSYEGFVDTKNDDKNSVITNFEKCIDAGNPVIKSYPEKCKVNDKIFVNEQQGLTGDKETRIIYPVNSSPKIALSAKEVRRYIYLRTDQLLPIQEVSSIPESGDLILVTNDKNSIVEELRGSLNHTTADGGIIIKTVSEDGRNVLIINGNDDDSTLHATYRYAENLGVFFDLA